MEQSSNASNSRHSSHQSSSRRSYRSYEVSSNPNTERRHRRPRPQRQEGKRSSLNCHDKREENHHRKRSGSTSNEHSSYRSQSTRSSATSRDPDGEYDANCTRGCEPRHRNMDGVDQYASTARKKAGLLKNHDSHRSRGDSDRDRRRKRSSAPSIDKESNMRGVQSRTRGLETKSSTSSSRRNIGDSNDENAQYYFEEQAQAEHIPPPTATSMVGQYIPSSAQSVATSVSSMSSKDSYVRQQMFLRDLERYKRVLRESGRHFDLIGEEDEYENDEEHIIQEEYEDQEENSMFENMKEDSQFCDTWEADGVEPSASVISTNDNDVDQDDATYSISGEGETRPAVSAASRTKNSSTRSPVYQLEECCIKHPHMLLQDQTEVNVWTCMRYCKDPRTGRWVTVKKVCTQCLREQGDDYFDEEWLQHSSSLYDRSRSTRSGGRSSEQHAHQKDEYGLSHSTDETWSNSSEDERNHKGQEHNGYTSSRGPIMSVYGDDGNQTPLEREAEAQRRRFIRRLAARAYHFPGNTWFEDWLQYTKNTHLVFGIFFHHPLHPVTRKERCIILLGSVAVGLLMSNLIYLWFVEANFGMNDPVLTLGPNGNVAITKLMVALWTLGSFAHTIFDLSIWHIKACTLCRLFGGHVSDRAVKCGRSTGVTIVLFTLAFAAYLVLLRASEDFKAVNGVDSDVTGDDHDDSFFHSIVLGGGAESFDFLLGYFVEFILAVFVYNPLILTVVFTGILGCDGRIPVLGGRPREVAKEQRYAMKRQRYIMPQTLKLGDNEYEADLWCDQKLATNF